MSDNKKPTRENVTPNVEPSGEMESAGHIGKGNREEKGGDLGKKTNLPNQPDSRRPEREDDDQQYTPRRTEPGRPSIEPDQEPYTRK